MVSLMNIFIKIHQVVYFIYAVYSSVNFKAEKFKKIQDFIICFTEIFFSSMKF